MLIGHLVENLAEVVAEFEGCDFFGHGVFGFTHGVISSEVFRDSIVPYYPYIGVCQQLPRRVAAHPPNGSAIAGVIVNDIRWIRHHQINTLAWHCTHQLDAITVQYAVGIHLSPLPLVRDEMHSRSDTHPLLPSTLRYLPPALSPRDRP